MRYKVMKPITTSLSSLLPKGAFVDCDDWPVRNVQSLIRQGYLQEVIREVQRESDTVTAPDLASGLAVAWQAPAPDTNTPKQSTPPVSQPRGPSRQGGK